jgi:hypothetical protein
MSGDLAAPRRVTIGAQVFELRPWSLADGRRWLYRLVSISTGAAASGGTDTKALGAVLKSVDEKTFLDLCDTVDQYTAVVTQSEDGREKVATLKSTREVSMRGQHAVHAQLIREHLVMEYADFFAGLPALLGQPAERKGP